MSQLLVRIAKLSSSTSSVVKQGLIFGELRFFSTASPYLLCRETNRRRGPNGETMVVDMNFYDPRKQERLKIPDQALSETSTRIGSSRGWVAMKNIQDSTISLTNIFNPSAYVSSRKVISLPPWDGHRDYFYCISLSASPNQQEDFVVAVKSSNFFAHDESLSLCRPGDSEWTHVKVPFFALEVIYSMRDRRLYLNSWEYDGRKLISLTLVAASSLMYREDWPKEDMESSEKKTHSRKSPRAFVVFRQDPEQKIGSYTEDIGDLCIFLGHSENFCISATEYPGLNPNSVYYEDYKTGVGFYDLSSNTIHDITDLAPFSNFFMWLAPLQ